MANGVSTQWDDLQVKFGNYDPKEKEQTLAQNYQVTMDRLENSNQNRKASGSEGDDLDDEIFAEYKRKRLEEMSNEQSQQQQGFGYVREISKEDYVEEVTNASVNCFVVLHLYQSYIEESGLINTIISTLAQKYQTIKFVKAQATRCVENFPDSSCPCFLIYKDKKIVSNLPKLTNFVQKITEYSIENLLIQQGVLPKPKKDHESDDEDIENYKNQYKGDREFSNTNTKVFMKY